MGTTPGAAKLMNIPKEMRQVPLPIASVNGHAIYPVFVIGIDPKKYYRTAGHALEVAAKLPPLEPESPIEPEGTAA